MARKDCERMINSSMNMPDGCRLSRAFAPVKKKKTNGPGRPAGRVVMGDDLKKKYLKMVRDGEGRYAAYIKLGMTTSIYRSTVMEPVLGPEFLEEIKAAEAAVVNDVEHVTYADALTSNDPDVQYRFLDRVDRRRNNQRLAEAAREERKLKREQLRIQQELVDKSGGESVGDALSEMFKEMKSEDVKLINEIMARYAKPAKDNAPKPGEKGSK